MGLDKATIFAKVLQGLTGFFSKGDSLQLNVDIPLPAPKAPEAPAPVAAPAEIDWTNPDCQITPHFKVKEALMLKSWGVMHIPSDAEKAAIVEIAKGVGEAVDYLETLLGMKCVVNVHAWIRPGKANCPGTKWDGMDYNRWIYENEVWKGLSAEEKAKKHVPDSPHKTGHAVDFHIAHFEAVAGCDKIRKYLVGQLERLGLRMEDIEGGWVHLDNLPVKVNRFFKP